MILCKTSDPGWGHFLPQGYNLNNLGRGYKLNNQKRVKNCKTYTIENKNADYIETHSCKKDCIF